MLLQKPEPSIQDLGRSLFPEEREEAAKVITPIQQIKSRCCYVEATNEKWLLGKK